MSSEVPFAPNVVPPSPEAANLAAYADIPVSLYTGIPEIAIPLYQLTERDVSLPIVLAYHASAHRVEDQASRVGLGWSLNAGGTISRSIRGLPDEYRPGGFLEQAADVGNVGAYALGSDEQRFGWYDAMARGCRSAEPDIYYFTFGSFSGTFQFDWDGSIRVASEHKLVITPIGLNQEGNDFIRGWRVITPDGVRWTFSSAESVATRFDGPAILSDPCAAALNFRKPPQTWHLTRISSPLTGSSVRLTYTDYFQTLERWSFETQIHNDRLAPSTPMRQKLISEVRGKYLAAISTSSGDTTIRFIPGEIRTDVTGSGLSALHAIRVRNRHGEMVRQWTFAYDDSTGRLTLKTLRESGAEDTTPPFRFDYYPGRLPSPLAFNQDHWGFPNGNARQTLIPRTVVPVVGSQRVVLDGADRSAAPGALTVAMLRQITYPTGGTDRFSFEPHEYSFEQSKQLKTAVTTTRRLSGSAPAADTPAGTEHVERRPFTLDDDLELVLTAGFTYGVRFGGALFQPAVEVQAEDGETVFRLAPGGTADPNGEPTHRTEVVIFNAKPDSDATGTIPTSPRLPAGDYVFVVRCKAAPPNLGRNGVAAALQWEQPTGEFTTRREQGGGVRIAAITRAYGFGNPDRTTTYRYDLDVDGERVSSGSLLESYYVYEKWMTYLESVSGGTIPGATTVQKFVRFSQNRAALGTTRGSHVGYRRVTVQEGPSRRNGTRIHTYTSPIEFPDVPDLDVPFAPPLSREYKRGLLLEQADFEYREPHATRRIINTYDFQQRSIAALKVGWRVPGTGPTGAGFLDRYAVQGYTNLVGYSRLVSKEEQLRDPPSAPTAFVTKATYRYQEHGHKQLTRETTTSSAGAFVTSYKYASDYPSGTSEGIDRLVELRVAGALIEKVRFKRDRTVLAAERHRYRRFGPRVHRSRVDLAAIGGSVKAEGSVFEAVAPLYETRGTYRAYDRHGNPLEYSQPGGMVTCLLWDRAGTQLVAKVDNATRGQVYYEGFEDLGDGTTITDAFTGSRSKPVSGVYTVPTAALPRVAGDYLLSYWHRSGGAPWTKAERVIRSYVPGEVIATDTIEGLVDEVRLHPLDAHMETFAHRPLFGLQTSTDAAGRPTYYEYDSLGRLATVRDHRRDISAHHEYAFTPDAGSESGALPVRPSHVRTYTARASGITSVAALIEADHRSVEESTEYLDAMGRTLQTVRRRASPAGKDMVQVSTYDALGREAKRFLPYTAEATDGEFKVIEPSAHPVRQFYSSGDPEVAKTSAPFTRTRFERSPLNRMVEKGAPGEAWQPTLGPRRTHRLHYRLNTQSDSVLRWRVVGDEVQAEEAYAAGDLTAQVTTDEHRTRLRVFTDGLGREILRAVEPEEGDEIRTYRVYDDRDNLIAIIPPRAAARHASAAPQVIRAAEVKRECYRFRFDGRDRVIEKWLPGVGPVRMVYDRWDRLALSQNGNQRDAGRWEFQKYDAHDRTILSGEIPLSLDREGAAAAVDAHYSSAVAERRCEVPGNGPHAYSNRSFPVLDDAARVDRVAYFDDYGFVGTLAERFVAPDAYDFQPELGVTEVMTRPVGEQTGSKLRVYGSGRLVPTATYFDDRMRPAQAVTTDHLGGRVRSTTEYDLSGNDVAAAFSRRRLAALVRVATRRGYDHADRPTAVRLQIDDEPPVVLSESQYNSLGQLIRKRLHSTDDAATFAQALEYRYHIRGWLTSINQGALEPPGDPTSLFALRLSYEDTLDSPRSVPQFNGNVSRVTWKTTAADAVQTYLYRYDGLDRLVAAHYRVAGASDRGFDESGIAYDPNGNISRLSRYSIVSGQRTLIDGLKYRYRGNQARSIRDTTGRAEGFRDGSGDSDDYEYDFNGNMVVDRNRGVRIRYNALNLVDEVSKTSGGSVRFGFDADGVKRFRELLAADSSVAERLDYVDNCVLQDGGLRLVMHDEGRLVRASDGERWRFQYFLTDHLGNVRVAFEPSPGGPGSPTTPPVVYAADYYPYGLRIDHGSGDDAGGAPVQHLLAGKELEDVLGLEWYDFGARMLDPTCGRWLVQDPEAEEHPSVSPYAYVSNNPLRYVDPDGRDWWEFSLFGQKVTLDPRDWAGPREQLKGLYKGANVAAAGVIGGAGTGAAAGCAGGAAVGAAGAGVGAAPGCGVGAAAGAVGGGIGGFISAAFADTEEEALKSGLAAGVLGGATGGATGALRAGWARVASRSSVSSAATVVETTNERLASLARVAESGGLRWVAGDAELYAAHVAARGAVGTREGRAAFNVLRRGMGKLLDIKGQPIHHWLYPITRYRNAAVKATNLYVTESSSVHIALHKAIGTKAKPFAEMAWGVERELQSMFNFWLKKP